MKVACVGGGPGGLFFATLLKQRQPGAEVVVFERNRPDDTFGFGVVFSDATLARIHEADPVLLRGLQEQGRHWDDIEVRLKGERLRVGGNGMAAISRKTLLQLLQERAREVGVDLRFETEVPGLHALDGYDVVVGCDGANSRVREELAAQLEPSFDEATAKFIWFGTPYMFEGLTFVHKQSPHGTFAVHGYPISADVSTFIVETDEATWRAAGLDEFDTGQPPGPSDERTRAFLEELFADEIGGQGLLVNNSRWANFRTRRARTWHAGNVAILGDAAHTAHFSVGSGTKMAMEDAIELARALTEHDDLETALQAYESAARPSVEKIQGSARPSLSWWEHFGRYHEAFEPTQFAFHFMSRSIGRKKIARRDPAFIAEADADWRSRHGAEPRHTPIALGDVQFPQRVVDLVEDGSGPSLECAGARLQLASTAPERGPWGLWLEAPESENALPSAIDRLREDLATGACAVVVHGGTPLTRVLLAEQARLTEGVPAVVVEAEPDDDRATTLLLSGRADLVAVPVTVRERAHV
ncbi:FAD-dependent monooxygenase [Georgenia yuyongxinii]|uniref:2-polyprenyl-6-methoxyphenol hydroxylase n=1 Tax=Georgenia yuyongxinii TaxID=2589797 RepID=A0A552WTB1_9MICO|nr:FAD-dependent monooxygenase [Georgenia yuyongxinii]TRW45819.1 2-polyprenyl-6-methoxyphenol hydroxylase [Georgenia yuyongxinii]